MLLHADLRLGKKVRFFAEGKTAFATDRTLPGGRRPLDVDEGDLQQAFVDVKTTLSDKSDMTFRFGRQELLFGKQRLVSPLRWGSSLRTFDGASIILNGAGWKATGFWTRPVPVGKFALNRPDHRTQFFGVYATRGIAPLGAGLDVYWLDLDRDRSSLGAAAGREQRHSVGAHLSGKIAKSSFDYDVEGTYQFGQFGLDTIRAHSLASQLGHRWAQRKAKPRLYAGFDYASGNKNENGRTGTFNQLFPLGHAYLGFMDSVGRQNVVDFSFGSAWQLHRRLTVDITAHNFWRASRFDAMYHAGGGVMRAADPSAPSIVGSEADITAKIKVDRHTVVTVGYSRFFAGAFLAATGPREGANFVYVWLQHNF
jgi:hypothetical protein